MRVFVAGATGAIGRPLVRQLIDRGHHVIAMTRSPGKVDSLRRLGAEAVVADGLDASAVGEAVARAEPDAIVHQMTALSGTPDLRRFDRWFAVTNALRTKGTEYLLAAAQAAGVRRVIAQSFTGWPNAREGGWVKSEDDPLDPHPAKAQRESLAAIRFLERAVVEAEPEGIVLRYGSFYGPGAWEAMVELARRLPPRVAAGRPDGRIERLRGSGVSAIHGREGAYGMSSPETFESLRPLLFAIAYRMLASASEAEDVLQEAYLRYRRALATGITIDSLKAYLSAVVTRLAMDHLRSAQARREEYVGVWIPEPLLTDRDGNDPAAQAELAESVSMAFLLVLERLNPVERAVFLLHDVFGYDFKEIAGIVAKSEVACRQIASRARRRVRAGAPRFDASPADRDRLAERFFAAVTAGDVDGLIEILAEDVTVYGDGGGKAPQWMAPIVGPDRVARLFVGVGRQMRELDLHFERRQVNGMPGAVVRDAENRVVSVFALDIAGGRVRTIRSVINPDKLRHIGPVADARALAAQRRRG